MSRWLLLSGCLFSLLFAPSFSKPGEVASSSLVLALEPPPLVGLRESGPEVRPRGVASILFSFLETILVTRGFEAFRQERLGHDGSVSRNQVSWPLRC